ncbi:Uncharacterised protein g8341 [Pycnogonum litorale]
MLSCSSRVHIILLLIVSSKLHNVKCISYRKEDISTETSVKTSLSSIEESNIVRFQLLGFFKCQNDTSEIITTERRTCETSFDGWGCWTKTEAGRMRTIPCPTLSRPDPMPVDDYAMRFCSNEGTWNDADYTLCTGNKDKKPETLKMMKQMKLIQKYVTEVYKTQEARKEYTKCLLDVLLLPTVSSDALSCPRMFDGWGCWNDTPAGTTAYIPCPAFILGFNKNHIKNSRQRRLNML